MDQKFQLCIEKQLLLNLVSYYIETQNTFLVLKILDSLRLDETTLWRFREEGPGDLVPEAVIFLRDLAT